MHDVSKYYYFFGLLYLSIIGGEKSIMHFRISIIGKVFENWRIA